MLSLMQASSLEGWQLPPVFIDFFSHILTINSFKHEGFYVHEEPQNIIMQHKHACDRSHDTSPSSITDILLCAFS